MIHTPLSEIIVSYFLKKFVEVFRDLNVNYSSQNEIARQNTIISSEEEKESSTPSYLFVPNGEIKKSSSHRSRSEKG